MRTLSASTVVTKLLSTLASHGRAALVPLYPITALRALLELGSLDKIDKSVVIFIMCVTDAVLSTGHTIVVVASAA